MEGNAQTGTFDNYGAQPTATDAGVVDTVRNAASTVAGKGHDALVAARDRAAEIPSMLADKLEAGADSIRPEHQPATAGGAGTLTSHTPVAQATDKLANGMQAGADWLRNADLNKLRDGIEQQVREKPAQSLLLALGVGYMLGKAVRR
ncbi:MAG: hypothetical protein JWM95_3015 [Gemmatimonadetes bacterium]|nr:hypothetical protein [Gemmatimonadota bacterium]